MLKKEKWWRKMLENKKKVKLVKRMFEYKVLMIEIIKEVKVWKNEKGKKNERRKIVMVGIVLIKEMIGIEKILMSEKMNMGMKKKFFDMVVMDLEVEKWREKKGEYDE